MKRLRSIRVARFARVTCERRILEKPFWSIVPVAVTVSLSLRKEHHVLVMFCTDGPQLQEMRFNGMFWSREKMERFETAFSDNFYVQLPLCSMFFAGERTLLVSFVSANNWQDEKHVYLEGF